MDESAGFDSRVKSIDERLESLRRQNEMSRLTSEITLLEHELNDLQARDIVTSRTAMDTPRPEHKGARPKRVLPTILF